MGCVESDSPFILQVSSGARKYANQTLLRCMAQGAMEMIKAQGSKLRFALHLDHGDTFELCKSCIETGFSSVMIDGSHHPYEKNIEETRKVVEYAHKYDVTVEGELGVLAGIEDDVVAAKSIYTQPDQVVDFVKKTGVDSLAISIGTSHGAYKFKRRSARATPRAFSSPRPSASTSWKRSRSASPASPSCSTAPRRWCSKYVDMINKYGGKMDDAVGIPEAQLRKAATSAVCKINIDSDGRLAMTAAIRKAFAENPKEFDPRKYLGPARDELKKLIIEKNKNVLGSAGRGKEIFS